MMVLRTPCHNPFMVLATQNRWSMKVPYRLPEAQLDRFFKIEVRYPSPDEEVKILQNAHHGITSHFNKTVHAVLNGEAIARFRQLVSNLHIEEKVMRYIASLVYETRNNKALFLGGDPRASNGCITCCQSNCGNQWPGFLLRRTM